MTEEITDFTKYEIVRILGSRALQISMGAPILIKLDEKELEQLKYNPVDIAKREFSMGAIPITVRRPLPMTREAKEQAKEKK